MQGIDTPPTLPTSSLVELGSVGGSWLFLNCRSALLADTAFVAGEVVGALLAMARFGHRLIYKLIEEPTAYPVECRCPHATTVPKVRISHSACPEKIRKECAGKNQDEEDSKQR